LIAASAIVDFKMQYFLGSLCSDSLVASLAEFEITDVSRIRLVLLGSFIHEEAVTISIVSGGYISSLIW
jgi:hypothetical protein